MVFINTVPSYYTSVQLSAYLDLLGISSDHRKPTLAALHVIVKCHYTKFPFENTEIHYTETGQMTILPEEVFKRMVQDRKGGGYCFGQHTLMLGMLRSIGYRAYPCMGRVNMSQEVAVVQPEARKHSVILVQLPDAEFDTSSALSPVTYVVDVGFGLGLTKPIALREYEKVDGIAPPEKHQLVRAIHPDNALNMVDPDSVAVASEWALQTNLTNRWQPIADGHWRTLHQFDLQQAQLIDFEVLSWTVANRPGGLFWNNVFAVVYHAEEDGHLSMTVMMGNKVTRRDQGQISVLREFTDEAGRLEALEEYFGIKYPPEAVSLISRKGAALKSP